ncbi:MAG TPA: hypothetical protein VGC13_11605 [Longimicrobium sp.]|jgi:hypothetical protein|uniref:hypothetical protein n=1 Tax=Longimicrobium sp. TaxID=2029185 RepID=UPI002EDAB7AD
MRIARIAAVTAGLAVAGALFGGLAGAVVLMLWAMQLEGVYAALSDPSILLMGAWFGGVVGAALGPLAAWLLMRHVPLWLAVGGTTLGTLAGGAVGMLLTGAPDLSMYAGMAGFTISAIALRVRTRPRSRTPLPPADTGARLSA